MIKPEGIIKAMPVEWVKKLPYGLEAWEKTYMAMNERENYWWVFNLPGKPKFEILYFYLLIMGSVRYRANIMGYEKEQTIKCYTGEMKHGKIWVQVTAPIIKAREPVPMKGFQGFRYTEFLF